MIIPLQLGSHAIASTTVFLDGTRRQHQGPSHANSVAGRCDLPDDE